MTTDLYRFDRGPVLAVDGDPLARRHFAGEYGEVAVREPLAATVEVSFGEGGGGDGGSRDGPWIQGGHKTMRWRTRLSDPGAETLKASVAVAGWPRRYGMSLVQGYQVEPLLSISAARGGAVLLPAAAFAAEGKAVILLGLSGSGKTSLSMQALALGYPLFGDDQVLLTPDGCCRPFPRRMRLYPDLRKRIPLAYERLPRMARAKLQLRRLARFASAGWLSPSLAVSPACLCRADPPAPAPIGRIVILIRTSSPGEPRFSNVTTGEAIDCGVHCLTQQRKHLAAGRDDWAAALRDTEQVEAGLLGRAFACAPAMKVVVPTPLDAPAMTNVARALGLHDSGPNGEGSI